MGGDYPEPHSGVRNPNLLYIANTVGVTARQIYDFIEGRGFKVDRIDMKDGTFCFVKSQQCRGIIHELNGEECCGTHLRIEWVKGAGSERREKDASTTPTDSLFIVNFDKTVGSRELREFFRGYEVDNIQMFNAHAFASCRDVEAAIKAKEAMDGEWLGSRQICVQFRASPPGAGRGEGFGGPSRFRGRSPPRRRYSPYRRSPDRRYDRRSRSPDRRYDRRSRSPDRRYDRRSPDRSSRYERRDRSRSRDRRDRSPSRDRRRSYSPRRSRSPSRSYSPRRR